MNVSIEISLYPLDKNYSVPIRNFLDRLNTREGINVKVHEMSTFVTGEYNQVMEVLTKELLTTMQEQTTSVAIFKIVNLDLSEQ